MYYTGIGARNTPEKILDLFINISKYLGTKDFTLRSGAANGADSAFEKGCDISNGSKEIYLPWRGFNNSKSQLIVEDIEAFNIAEKYHPYWINLKAGAKKLQARNSHQVLGLDLHTPSEFIICYTENGKRSGGTGQALRIAEAYDIPIFDVGAYDDIFKFKIEFWKFLINNYGKVIENEGRKN